MNKQEQQVEHIISKEEMKRLEAGEEAVLLEYGYQKEYLASYNGKTYVLRNKEYYELLK